MMILLIVDIIQSLTFYVWVICFFVLVAFVVVVVVVCSYVCLTSLHSVPLFVSFLLHIEVYDEFLQ